MSKSQWLFQFEKPGFHEIARLREILAKMEITSAKGPRLRAMADMTLEGPLDQIIARLEDVLQQDFAENHVEQLHKPWAFEYVVTDKSPDTGAIEVWTRLFNPSDSTMGSAFYGRAVKRISQDTYRLWVDDDEEGLEADEGMEAERPQPVQRPARLKN
jgi:hypothetical protein